MTGLTASAQQAPVDLGSTSTYGILANTTVTFTGAGSETGDIGISPGTAIVYGSPGTVVNGTVNVNNGVAAQAQLDLGAAIADADDVSRGNPTTLSGNIGGLTLNAGLYHSTSSLAVSSGDLTLDALGDPNAVFIFQINSTFSMTAGRKVILANRADAKNIFWQVGTAATLAAGAVLHGTILAGTSISLLTGARLDGRALAHGAAVTVDTGGFASLTIPTTPASQFIPVAPCRVTDTRNATGALGGPFLVGQSIRSFPIPSGACGIPLSALAYSMNVAVVPHGPFAYLTAWATGDTQPVVSTLNSDGRVKSSAAIIPAGTFGAVSVFVSHDTDVVMDINGYFAPLNTTGDLAFYPLTPCRLSDTRTSTGTFGGPFLAGQTSRTIPVLLGSCGVPSGAAAYALNLAAVPHGPLGYLTAWATGATEPYIASLNASSGVTTSNAAIVPAGTAGSINVFASNDTDLVIDIYGYFATPGVGGLSYYNLSPCRVLDSRLPTGTPAFTGTLNVDLVTSTCLVPVSAQAYVLTSVAVPPGPLGYVTIWGQGTAQPPVASINAADGAITSNMSVATTSNGQISAFTSNPTHLVLDIFGYFAP